MNSFGLFKQVIVSKERHIDPKENRAAEYGITVISGRIIAAVFIMEDIFPVKEIGYAEIKNEHSVLENETLAAIKVHPLIGRKSAAERHSPVGNISLVFSIPFPAQQRGMGQARCIGEPDAQINTIELELEYSGYRMSDLIRRSG